VFLFVVFFVEVICAPSGALDGR